MQFFSPFSKKNTSRARAHRKLFIIPSKDGLRVDCDKKWEFSARTLVIDVASTMESGAHTCETRRGRILARATVRFIKNTRSYFLRRVAGRWTRFARSATACSPIIVPHTHTRREKKWHVCCRQYICRVTYIYIYVCVCVYMCMRVCVRAYTHVFAMDRTLHSSGLRVAQCVRACYRYSQLSMIQ